jgi:NTP pyrophosphatase (non-canonical NTP hydrolase)
MTQNSEAQWLEGGTEAQHLEGLLSGRNMDPLPDSEEIIDMDDVQAECYANSRRWFPALAEMSQVYQLLYHGLGLCDEAGEIAGPIKKLNRIAVRLAHDSMGDANFRLVDLVALDANASDLINEIRSELADVFAYLANLAEILDTSIYDQYKTKAEQNENRVWKGGAGPVVEAQS